MKLSKQTKHIEALHEVLKDEYGADFICYSGNELGYELEFSDLLDQATLIAFLAQQTEVKLKKKSDDEKKFLNDRESLEQETSVKIKKVFGDFCPVKFASDVQLLMLMKSFPAQFIDTDLDSEVKVLDYADKKLAKAIAILKTKAKKLRVIEKKD